MSRFTRVYCTFYAPTDLATALSDGSTTARVPISGTTDAYKNAHGESEFVFMNDTGLNTMAAIGNVCWARVEDSQRSGDFPNGWTFAEPFIIRNRVVGPEPNQLTISGPDLLSELLRFTIYRPLGNLVTTNTTILAGNPAAGPVTGRTLQTGAPAGNNSFHPTDTDPTDLHKELLVEQDDASWFSTVVQEIRYWEGEEHLACRDRIPVQAAAGNDLELRTKRIRVTAPANFQEGAEIDVTMDGGAGIHSTLIERGPSGDSGDMITLRDGLTAAASAGNAVTSRDYSTPSTTDVTQIMAFASGWSVDFETGTGTEQGTRYGGGGETVYDILQSVAAATGEYFRFKTADAPTVGAKRTLVWRRTADAAGLSGGKLRLVMPTTASMATDSADTNKGILIQKPRHAGYYDPVTQVIPVAGDARITLYSCSSAAIARATAAGYTVVTTGLGLYAAPYVKDAALDTSIGVHQRRVSFSDVTVEGENVNSIQAAADLMLDQAVTYLKTHKTAQRVIEVAFVTAQNVVPGNTIEIDYTAPTGEYSLSYTGATPLYVQSVRREVSADHSEYPGVPITYCELTTEPYNAAMTRSSKAENSVGRRLQAIDRLMAQKNTPALIRMSIPPGSGTGPTPTPPPPADGVDESYVAAAIATHAAIDDAHHDPVTVSGTDLLLTGQQLAVETTTSAITAPAEILKSTATGGLTLANLGVGENVSANASLLVKATDTTDVGVYVKRITNQTGAVLRIDDEDGNLVIRSNGSQSITQDAQGGDQYTFDLRGPGKAAARFIAGAGITLPTDEDETLYRQRFAIIDGIPSQIYEAD